jgi:predicted DNA-binding transcriptional regulator AlpA
MRAELATLLADPERLDDVPLELVPRLIGEAAALQARLWARLQTPPAPPPAVAGTGIAGPDRLLNAGEAAALLGVARRWVYRHAPNLPFTRRLSSGTLRFSLRGIERWQASRPMTPRRTPQERAGRPRRSRTPAASGPGTLSGDAGAGTAAVSAATVADGSNA